MEYGCQFLEVAISMHSDFQCHSSKCRMKDFDVNNHIDLFSVSFRKDTSELEVDEVVQR